MVLDYNIDYPATYSFTNDANNSFPSGWAGAWVRVIASKAYHNKCAEFHAYIPANMNQWLDEKPKTGIIEFWLYLFGIPGVKRFIIQTRDIENAGYGIEAMFYCGAQKGLYVWNKDTVVKICEVPLDSWFHVRFIFDCDTSSYRVYLDGHYKTTCFFDIRHPALQFDYISLEANTPCEIDALDYSWSNEWYLGRNRLALEKEDWVALLYYFLKENWDQTTFPADIIYQKEETRDISDNAIQIKLSAKDTTNIELSKALKPFRKTDQVLIQVELKKTELDWKSSQEYLRDIQEELVSTIAAIPTRIKNNIMLKSVTIDEAFHKVDLIVEGIAIG